MTMIETAVAAAPLAGQQPLIEDPDPLCGALAGMLAPLYAATPGPWWTDDTGTVYAPTRGSASDAAAVAAIPDLARRLTGAAWTAPVCTGRGDQDRLVLLTRALAVSGLGLHGTWEVFTADPDGEWAVGDDAEGVALASPFDAWSCPGQEVIAEACDPETGQLRPEHRAAAELVALARTELPWLAGRVAEVVARGPAPKGGAYERAGQALLPVPASVRCGPDEECWPWWLWHCRRCHHGGRGPLAPVRMEAAAHACEGER